MLTSRASSHIPASSPALAVPPQGWLGPLRVRLALSSNSRSARATPWTSSGSGRGAECRGEPRPGGTHASRNRPACGERTTLRNSAFCAAQKLRRIAQASAPTAHNRGLQHAVTVPVANGVVHGCETPRSRCSACWRSRTMCAPSRHKLGASREARNREMSALGGECTLRLLPREQKVGRR